jgi:26S proteasome regulatory subunit N13
MYSDLFDQLGAGGGGVGGRRGGGGGAAVAPPPVPPPLVSFKAGKMILTKTNENSDTYKCEPDTKRGEVRLTWQDNALKWQFYDRRDKKVLESHSIPIPTSANADGTTTTTTTTTTSTLERVLPISSETSNNKRHKKDRIYVWTRPWDGSYDMYWMQDASDEKEEEVVATVNQYLADPASAAPPPAVSSASSIGGAGSGAAAATGTAAAAGGGGGGGGRIGFNVSSSGHSQNQVDALSSILENLGMPQGGSTDSSLGGVVHGSAMTSSGAAPTGTLTLADLQGAMASMPQQQQQQPTAPRPSVLPLSEIITPAAIAQLLEHEEVCNRLLELLPEEQRSRQFLEENLRSPQIQQTLRSLTQALLPDDNGNMDGFYSVLANFQLDPAPGQAAMVGAGAAGGNMDPIQAFLDCLLASVEKEEGQGDGSGGSGNGASGEDANMENDKDEDKDGSSGDGEEKQQEEG